MKHKYIFFILPFVVIIIWLLLIPFYNLFSFADFSNSENSSENKLLTEFNISELKQLNEVLKNLDDSKITDSRLKTRFLAMKDDFIQEEYKLEEEQKKLEEAQKKQEEENKRIEEERKKQEEEEKKRLEAMFPKEFDITKDLAKLHIINYFKNRYRGKRYFG